MKDFVKTMLAVICGYIVLRLIVGLFFLFMIMGALLGGSGSGKVLKGSLLDVDMSTFVVAEQTQESMPDFTSITSFGGAMLPTLGLHDAVTSIQAAAADPAIEGIFLRPDAASMGMAEAEELRIALQEFRRSGKPVVAYMENPTNGGYYMATVADKVWLADLHGQTPQLLGLSSQQLYLKDILDKLGVHVQLIRHGKYKSAGEMFIRSSSSPENREQNQVLLNSAWSALSATMAESRDIPVEKLNALIDNLQLVLPKDMLENGLVDELVDHEGLLNHLTTLTQVDDAAKLRLAPFADYVQAQAEKQPLVAPRQVAVLYMQGEIVDGQDYADIAGDRFVREIDKLRKDKSVKAVVLRVSSPGGSVSASEKIKAALDLLQQEKPLVASYGNYAASGGYWISNGCQKIYADATTITGSIGVFAMIPEFSAVTKKVGVGVETLGSNKHSDMFSLVRPFDDAEMAYLQASIEDVYERFVGLVAQGRGMTTEAVDAIAQGRVWLGSDALGIGLVDEIGTLEDAIRYTASLADFTDPSEYTVVGYPQPLTMAQQILQTIGESQEEPYVLSGTPFEGLGREVSRVLSGRPGAALARMPYTLEIK